MGQVVFAVTNAIIFLRRHKSHGNHVLSHVLPQAHLIAFILTPEVGLWSAPQLLQEGQRK